MSYERGYTKTLKAAGLVKEARGEKLLEGAKSWGSKALDHVPGLRQAQGGYRNYREAGQVRKDYIEEMDWAAKNNAPGVWMAAPKARSAINKLRVESVDDMLAGGGKMLGTGAGIAGVGAGISHARGPADTYQNKVKQVSNQHLGTDFKQQSRFNRWRNS